MLDLVLKVGLSAAPLVIGNLIYEKNPYLAGFCIIMGITLTSITIITEANYRYKEGKNRERGLRW